MKNEAFRLFSKITKLGNRAVRKAQDENRRLGVPNVYCLNGKIVYEVNGKITTKSPFRKAG